MLTAEKLDGDSIVFARCVRFRKNTNDAGTVYGEGDVVQMPAGGQAVVVFFAIDEQRHYSAVTHAHSETETVPALGSAYPSKLRVCGRADPARLTELAAIREAYLARRRQQLNEGKASQSARGQSQVQPAAPSPAAAKDMRALSENVSKLALLVGQLMEKGLTFERDGDGDGDSSEGEAPAAEKPKKGKRKGAKAKAKGSSAAKKGSKKRRGKTPDSEPGSAAVSPAEALTAQLQANMQAMATVNAGLEHAAHALERAAHAAHSHSHSHAHKESDSDRDSDRDRDRDSNRHRDRDRDRGRGRDRERDRRKSRDRHTSESRSHSRSPSPARSHSPSPTRESRKHGHKHTRKHRSRSRSPDERRQSPRRR